MTLRDYIIETEYLGISPRCSCGLCDEIPEFSRGKFRQYAKNHQRFSVKEQLYRKRFGNPVCQNPTCKKFVSFSRGEPQKYCSLACFGKCNGFSLETTQAKVKKTIRERYGVENVACLPHVRKSAQERMIVRNTSTNMSKGTKKKIGDAAKERWQNSKYHQKTSSAIRHSILVNKNERQRRSDWLSEKMADENYRINLWANHGNRLSKLHEKVRNEIALSELGFESEQRVLRYFADELHSTKKIIVEVNGDYIHANPDLYCPNDVIRLPGQSYTAQEKWEADMQRTKALEAAGYTVFIIWESDDLSVKKCELLKILDATQDS